MATRIATNTIKVAGTKTNRNNSLTDNLPSARRILDSLRYVGYKIDSAVCDIIDNSIDAKASRVWVEIKKDVKTREYTILIADDGLGMDSLTLNEAMRLGSEEVQYSESSLGKFGFGLITASISVCRRVEVITRSEDAEEVLFSAQDLDVIAQRNVFVKEGPRPASNAETEMLNSYCGANEAGTLVVWKKCDLIKDPDINRMVNTIRNKVAQTFRVFLAIPDSLTIIFNNDRVGPTDFLLQELDGSELFSDETYSIKIKSGNETREELVRCRLAILPYEGIEMGKSAGITYARSGFSILRNLREIAFGETLGMFTKHQLMNHFRGEIYFPSSLDDHLGINFAKMNFEISKSVFDQLEAVIRPQIRTIRRKISRKMSDSAARKKNATDFSAIEQYIKQRSAVLVKPHREIEKRHRTPGLVDGRKPATIDKSVRQRTKLTKKDLIISLDAVCKFIPTNLGVGGPIYEATIRGKRLEIEVNTDHHFYDRFILGTHRENVDLYNGVGFLLYAMASAEKIVMDEDIELVMLNWKSIMAANLNTLLTS